MHFNSGKLTTELFSNLIPNCTTWNTISWMWQPVFRQMFKDVSTENAASSQSQSYITTDDQSVSTSWFRAHSGTCDQILLRVWKLLSCFCVAPSLTRGRVCLQVICQNAHLIFTLHEFHTVQRCVWNIFKVSLSLTASCFTVEENKQENQVEFRRTTPIVIHESIQPELRLLVAC
jgi:hypothetical protein